MTNGRGFTHCSVSWNRPIRPSPSALFQLMSTRKAASVALRLFNFLGLEFYA